MSRRNEDYDEFCDPENPRLIKYEDVVKAATLLKSQIPPTPCMAAHTQREFGIYIHYKLEFMHGPGSFKGRGALFALLKLPTDKKKLGVVVASTGNEAIAFSYHAQRLKIPIVVVFPYKLPLTKTHLCMSLGAKVIVQGQTLAEAQKYARALAKEKGLGYINGRDHPHVLTGYGTLALEILAQAPFVDAIILPTITGCLAGAIASVVKHDKPSCLVYGVECDAMPMFTKSLEKQEPITNMPMQGTLMNETLTMNAVSVNGFANAKSLIDKMHLVKDEWIARAMLHLAEREKFIVEGAGAATLATIIGNLVPELKTKNVVCILTGGNVDDLMFNRSLQRGLAAEGRLIKFRVGVLDRAGAKTALLKLISDAGYNIIAHFIDNTWMIGETYYIEVKLVCETKGLEHALELKRIIEKAYPITASFDYEPFNDKRTCPCYAKK